MPLKLKMGGSFLGERGIEHKKTLTLVKAKLMHSQSLSWAMTLNLIARGMTINVIARRMTLIFIASGMTIRAIATGKTFSVKATVL
jgi:hypothetical protein